MQYGVFWREVVADAFSDIAKIAFAFEFGLRTRPELPVEDKAMRIWAWKELTGGHTLTGIG